MNFALEARVEIAMYRVLYDVDRELAWAHYDKAIEAALKAYDAGQSDSPLLADESMLIRSARVAREDKIPLNTHFVEWLKPLDQAVPSAGIGLWAEWLDGFSLHQWTEVGDRAADFTAGMRYDDLKQAASLALGEVWNVTERCALDAARVFSGEAEKRVVVEQTFCGWRIRNMGYAVLGATAERLLAALRPERMPSTAMWFNRNIVRGEWA